jgi:DNA-binding transcriptional MerR regulator
MYSIKQLSVLTGIKPHTIRVWEKRYEMFSPDRTDTNIRRYSEDDLRLALNVKMLLSVGYRISRISRMSQEEMSTIINQGNKYVGPPPVPESLLTAAINMDEEAFVEKLNEFVKERGFEWTYENLLVPFQKRMGLLWQSGGIVPAQEHFTSNILRNAIIKATLDLNVKTFRQSRILFYLPEGELHEIGLLYFNYLALAQGYSTTYLGQTVPIDDVIKVATKQGIEVLFAAFAVSMPKDVLAKHFEKLKNELPNAVLVVTGHQVEVNELDIPKGVHKVSSANQFTQFLSKQVK